MGKDDLYARHSAKYWRGKADEARTKADSTLDPTARATMLRIAALYDGWLNSPVANAARRTRTT
jgi:hypothetical protein